MVDISTVLVAVAAVFLIILVVWFLLRNNREEIPDSLSYIDPQGQTQADTDGRQIKGGSSIPISERARGLSMTAKIMFTSIGLLFVILAFFAYQTIRTGSPAEVMFADQLQTIGVALIGVVGGIIAVNMVQKREGTIYNVYETDSGETRCEEIPVDVSDVEADSEGQTVVKEYKKRRVAGLFRRYKMVAEDPELEDTFRAPGKPVTHQISDHAVEVEPNVWVQRTERKQSTADPSIRPDYVYGAPHELSFDQYLQMRESKRRIEQKLKSVQATNSVLSQELQKLTTRLKSGEHKAEQELIDKFDEIVNVVLSAPNEQTGQAGRPQSHITVNESAKNGHSQGHTQPQRQATNGEGRS